MSFIIIRLLQAFEGFELDESMGGKFCPKLTLTFYAGGGIWIKAKEAGEIEEV
ncbi:uncharacterized protein ARMOST_01068 [Armillaria ostoyae]|nr:uncharacterized protein ARMOST_01068 [Armillaria ostoyae]